MEDEKVRYALFTLEVSREELLAHCHARESYYRTKAETNLARATKLRDGGAGDLGQDVAKLIAEAITEGEVEDEAANSLNAYGMRGLNRIAIQGQLEQIATTLENRAKGQTKRAKEFAFYGSHLPDQRRQLLRFDEIDRLELAGEVPQTFPYGIHG